MARKQQELSDDVVTFDPGSEDDYMPTQRGTLVNDFEEASARKPLAVADVADRITGKKKEKKEISPEIKAGIAGLMFGLFIFSAFVVFDVVMSS